MTMTDDLIGTNIILSCLCYYRGTIVRPQKRPLQRSPKVLFKSSQLLPELNVHQLPAQRKNLSVDL